MITAPTDAQKAEDAGYPPTLVDAIRRSQPHALDDRLFVCRLRDGQQFAFASAELVGDGSMWVSLVGVIQMHGMASVDVRIDDISWLTETSILDSAPRPLENDEREEGTSDDPFPF